MININNKALGYKPNLQYSDTYETSLNTTVNEVSLSVNNSDELTVVPDKVEDLINSLPHINTMVTNLPHGFGDAVLEVLKPVGDFIYDELKDKIYSDVPDETETEYVDKEESDIEDTHTSIWDTDDFFEIVDTNHSKEEIIEKEYIKNLTDLFEDYVYNLKNTVSNFWANYMLAINKKSESEIVLINSNILLSSKDIKDNSRHLLDSAVREQIYKTYKADYYKLTYSLEETLKRLNNFKAVKELRLRYATIEEENGYNRSNQMSNNILQISRLMYDDKYDTAYENLYRYLNSSNGVIDEVFTTWIHEIKSKQTLIEKGGIL